MNIFIENHRLVLKKLIETEVDFMLVGGYAVNYYGYNRVTGDMDIWIKPDNLNKLLLLDALAVLDFDEEGINTIKSWDFTTAQIFNIFEKPQQTEFMTHISGVKYNEAKLTAIHANIDGLAIPLIHIQSLITNKKATGRLKDLTDAAELEKILHLKINKK